MAERPKVLLVITKGIAGGAQRYVSDLAARLPVNEWNPVVAYGEGGSLGERLAHMGVRAVHIEDLKRDIGFGREAGAFFSLLKLIREEKPEILHLNSSKAGFLGALAGRIAGVPTVIFTAHNWAFNYDVNPAAKIAYKIVHWLTVMLCHKTIAVSKKVALDMASFPFVKKKLKVVYNGIEPAELEAKSKVKTLLAPTIHEAVWIGTVSELHRNKGLDFALEAFAELVKRYAHIAFVVIGGSGTAEGAGEAESLSALVEKLGIGHKVHFLGPIQDASLFLKAFDIFTLTSRTEALPYTILEAGRAELAVVASRVGGIPEIIENGKSGLLVPPGNIKEIEKALADLIDHPEKRDKLGKKLSQIVAKKFSVDKMVAETAKVYRS